MKKNSLASKGLSLSQAQSISNLCHQRASQIDQKLKSVNNVSKTVKIDGADLPMVEANALPAPEQVVSMLMEKARLHATQAFLMENINAKEEALNNARRMQPDFNLPQPTIEDLEYPNTLSSVSEEWGWEQLSKSEINEFIEAEAYAAHLHQFINASGKLTQLRNELPNINRLEWMEVEAGKKTPVIVRVHHDADDLLKLHENIASLHRKYEQRVNYFKAKVKNLVTAENARIAKHNSDLVNEFQSKRRQLQAEFETAYKAWDNARLEALNKNEIVKQEEIQKIASYRIEVDPRFAETVNQFLTEDTDN